MALTGKAPGPSLSICLESSFSKPKNREIQHFSCLEARPRQQRGFAGVQSCAAESLCPLSSLPKGFFAPSSCPREDDASCTPGSLSCRGGSQHSPLVAPHVPAAAMAAAPGGCGAEDAPDISGGGSPCSATPNCTSPSPTPAGPGAEGAAHGPFCSWQQWREAEGSPPVGVLGTPSHPMELGM